MRLHLRFHPQAWINDYAVAVDPEGPTEFFVEFGGELPDDDSYESDEFRELDGAPEWVRNWSGPFYIEILNREKLK